MTKNTMAIPADQASDSHTSWAAWPPSNKARTADTVTLRGWLRAKPWSQPGRVLTGTMALLANSSRKVGPVPALVALSGSLTAIPMAAFIQQNA